MTPEQLEQRRKAAVTLVALGPDRAALVLRELGDGMAQSLAEEVAALGRVAPEEVQDSLAEVITVLTGPRMLRAPGSGYVRDLLHRALGAERGEEAAAELEKPKPFAWLADADPTAAGDALINEAPAVVAIALAHCPPKPAAALLTRLPEPMLSIVATRIASMAPVHPVTLEEVEQALRARFGDTLKRDARPISGPEVLATLLQRTDRDTLKLLLQGVAFTAPELAEETRAALFTFDDLTRIEGRQLQILLKGVEARDLALALYGGSERMKTALLSNMSERGRENLTEEMDLLGKVKSADVYDAQFRVVAVARRMEEEGTLELTQADDDD